MISKMTQYSFILLHGDKEQFLSELQGLGVMDITRASKPVDSRSQSLLDNIRTLRDDIACTEKGLDDTLADLLATHGALERELAEAEPWGDYDRERLAVFGLHFYRVPSKKYDPAWEEQYAIQVVDRNEKEDTRFVIVGDNAGFPVRELPAPKRTVAELKALLQEQEGKIDAHRRILEARKADIPQMQREVRVLESELDRYLAGTAAVPAAEDTIDTLVGFAPTENDAAVTEYIDRAAVYYIKSEATLEDNPPIKLKNNKFVKMFEVLTDMYGRPAYDEFDPTPILGPFFLLFFAMCMGDAGYGLLLVLIGWLLKKKVPSMADMGPLVMTLGVGTFIVGIILHTFFGINLYTAPWVPAWLKGCMVSGSIAGYDAQMVLAIGIGVFHICLAMVVKAICFTSRYGFAKCISTWGWTLLIVGTVITGGLALLGVIATPVVKVVMIVLGIVSGVSIFLLNDLKRNPLLNVGSGLWETYNTVTGLMGDVLSYLRLYALGLAGGMLGSTFNTLADMVLGVPVPGLNFLLFAALLLIGHVLNLALSCLGAFVHPLRLTFVEYFKNSGYEGTGRTYRPLKTTNK